MKSNLSLISLIFLFTSTALAQNAALDSASAMVKRDAFSAAISTLQPVLKDSAQLSEKEKGTAHCLMSEAVLGEGKLSVDETRYREGISANHMDFLTASFSHLMAAAKVNDAALKRKVDNQARILKRELMNACNQNFQGVVSQEDSLIKQNLLKRNLLCTEYLLVLDSTYPLAYNYRARTLQTQGNDLEAYEVLQKGLKVYLETERREPDVLALEMVAKIARIQQNVLKDPNLAKETIAQGLALLDKEDESVTNNTGMTQMRKDRVFAKVDEVRIALKELQGLLEE